MTKEPNEEVQPDRLRGDGRRGSDRWGWLGIVERRWTKKPNEEVQPSKTVWDLLQLLIIPLMLLGIAYFLNASRESQDRSRAEDAREDATLESYFVKMSDLMLDRNLLHSESGSSVRNVARTATLSTLRRVDGERKGEVVRFLFESKLLIDPDPVIDLEGADLRGADLANAPLSHKTQYFLLLEGDLRGAKFDHTTLRGQFQGNLKGASFKGARLEAAVFVADLRGASFKGATLLGANLACNKLDGAVFDDAFILAQGGRAQDGRLTTFQDADLDNTSFVGATFNPHTIFLGAHGKHVDFSNAVNLSSPIRPPPKGYFSSCKSFR